MRTYHHSFIHPIEYKHYGNITLADESWLNTNIQKGKTVLAEANLTVPKDYNYIVKIEVWRNGSMLKVWSSSLSLAPTKRIPKNITEEKVGFKVGEFVVEKTPMPIRPSKTSTPGFEIPIAILALKGALILRRIT